MTGQAGDTEARQALLDAKAAILREWAKVQSGRERWTDEMWAAAAVMALRMDGLLVAALPSGTTEPPAPGEEGLRGRIKALCDDSVARHYGVRYGAPAVGVETLRAALSETETR